MWVALDVGAITEIFRSFLYPQKMTFGLVKDYLII